MYTSVNADMDASPWGTWLLNIVYAPLLLWGPLLGAVTVHYCRRRTAVSHEPATNPRSP